MIVAHAPKAARRAFEEFTGVCYPVFLEHGALWIADHWELDVPDGKRTDFRRAVAARADEAIVFGWVQWPGRAARDAGNARIMDDPRLAALDCPFDSSRLLMGGFVPVLQTGL